MEGWQVFFEIPGKPPVELREGESIIGRSRASTVHIPETTVSRQHAKVVVGDGMVRVVDLGSSNGTFVNGDKIEGEKPLADGDRLLIGDAELTIRILKPGDVGEATMRVSIPPMGASAAPASTVRMDFAAAAAPPLPAAPAPSPAPSPAPPPAPSAATVAAPVDLPIEPPRPAPPPPIAAPPKPAAPPPPPPVAAPPKPPLPPAPAASGEVLGSIADLDKLAPPPPARSAAATPVAAPVATGAGRFAGFWSRFFAYLIDLVPVFVLSIVGAILPFFSQKLAFVALLTMFLSFGWIFYNVLFLPATRGTTFGKRMLGLAIVTDATAPGQGLGWGKAFLRLVGYFVNSFTAGIGYLLIAFTAKKQGLHDLIAGTYVVRTK